MENEDNGLEGVLGNANVSPDPHSWARGYGNIIVRGLVGNKYSEEISEPWTFVKVKAELKRVGNKHEVGVDMIKAFVKEEWGMNVYRIWDDRIKEVRKLKKKENERQSMWIEENFSGHSLEERLHDDNYEEVEGLGEDINGLITEDQSTTPYEETHPIVIYNAPKSEDKEEHKARSNIPPTNRRSSEKEPIRVKVRRMEPDTSTDSTEDPLSHEDTSEYKGARKPTVWERVRRFPSHHKKGIKRGGFGLFGTVVGLTALLVPIGIYKGISNLPKIPPYLAGIAGTIGSSFDGEPGSEGRKVLYKGKIKMSSDSDFDGVVDNPESSEVFWVRYEEGPRENILFLQNWKHNYRIIDNQDKINLDSEDFSRIKIEEVIDGRNSYVRENGIEGKINSPSKVDRFEEVYQSIFAHMKK